MYKSRGRTYPSDSEHVVLLPKGAGYHWVCTAPGECLMIEFESDSDSMNGNLMSIRVNNFADIVGIANRLERMWVFKKPAYVVRCMAGLYEILTRLSEADLLSCQVSLKRRLIKPSVDYLEANYNQPSLTNDQLAAQSGISTVYFRKIFTGIYQVSPMKYVRSIRIEKAKGMLIGDYNSVGDVAAAVGFESIYHFSKTFKSATGYAPTVFSRMHRACPEAATAET